VNDQHMYDLSTPTFPDHLADITAGMRRPARVEHVTELAQWEDEGGTVIDA
jgi:hypothetical protein